LRKDGVELEEVNYATGKTALTEAVIKDLVTKAGSVTAIMNARHATAKAKGWEAKPPSAAVFAKAAAAEPNLLKRPILVAGDKVIVGFAKTAYAALPKKPKKE
jgi:arsenate reductase-like glutaredoxin family protein